MGQAPYKYVAIYEPISYPYLTFVLQPKKVIMEKTRLSNKGQVVIPKAVRALHGWKPGIEFVVEDAGNGIVLKPVKSFCKTRIEDVIGCVGYKGSRKSLKDMDDAIAKGAIENK